jgi:hypothetical protein
MMLITPVSETSESGCEQSRVCPVALLFEATIVKNLRTFRH